MLSGIKLSDEAKAMLNKVESGSKMINLMDNFKPAPMTISPFINFGSQNLSSSSNEYFKI